MDEQMEGLLEWMSNFIPIFIGPIHAGGLPRGGGASDLFGSLSQLFGAPCDSGQVFFFSEYI